MKTNLLEMRGTNSLGPWQDLKHVLLQSVLYTWNTWACHAWWGYIWSIHCWFTSFKKHQKTKEVLCLLIFTNILALRFFGFPVLAKKNSWSHSQFDTSFWGFDQNENSNNSPKSHWCSMCIYWFDSYLSCHSVSIIFTSDAHVRV